MLETPQISSAESVSRRAAGLNRPFGLFLESTAQPRPRVVYEEGRRARARRPFSVLVYVVTPSAEMKQSDALVPVSTPWPLTMSVATLLPLLS
jgi:hypothetical protein